MASVLGLLLSAAPAGAEPLAFGDIGPQSDRATLARLATCDAEQSCTLRRETIGGIEIRSSRLAIDAAGRPRRLDIHIARDDAPLAAQLLDGRYGAGRRSGGRLFWRGFDGGGTLGMFAAGDEVRIGFAFPPIAAPPAQARRLPDAPLFVLGFALFGLLSGGVIARRTRRRRVSDVEPTMRATLDQRLRDGRGLEF